MQACRGGAKFISGVHINAQSSPESNRTRTDDAIPDVGTEILLQYSAIRSGVPDDGPTTVLNIGAERTLVATGNGSESAAVLVLAIGSRNTAANHFKHVPPTPNELENAIVTVEDEVARARTIIAGGSTLSTTDAAVREIALVAGIPDRPEMILARDAVERTFERLAAVTLGRPAARDGIPTGAAFAATLLILREFMHHLQFPSITVKV